MKKHCSDNLVLNCQGNSCSFLHALGLFISSDGPPALKPDTKEASFFLSSSQYVTSESRVNMNKHLNVPNCQWDYIKLAEIIFSE